MTAISQSFPTETDKYFPTNFATRQREEVYKLNALVDGVAAAATAVTVAAAVLVETTRAEAAEVLLAPKDSPAFSTFIDPPKSTTTNQPAYVEGRIYYDVTLHKLRVGGATAYETLTSV
jgi:hypothetical protein